MLGVRTLAIQVRRPGSITRAYRANQCVMIVIRINGVSTCTVHTGHSVVISGARQVGRSAVARINSVLSASDNF